MGERRLPYSNIRALTRLIIILFISEKLPAQEIKPNNEELKMNFPSAYFKYNSTDYAPMPCTADSCFKYISLHIKDINDIVIWRDSTEMEKLTDQRIKKIKSRLNKYKLSGVYFESMKKEQKISRHTIEMNTYRTQAEYLLSLNSVFDISKGRSAGKKKYTNHIAHPRITCWGMLEKWVPLANADEIQKNGKTK
jgi:hypothetical protein